jgi:hypothetical protein
VHTAGVPFDERGGVLRGCLDLVSGRFPRFVFGGRLDPAKTLPVFHFHDVTPDDLEPKLRFLAENGYKTLNADELAAYVRKERRFDGPRVVLCFDDAWTSLWTVAGPLLKRHGLTGITYAIPARIADASGCRRTIDDRGWSPGGGDAGSLSGGSVFSTWPELRSLQRAGNIDVQCHTESHAMVFCSGEIDDFVTPDYKDIPLLNRPLLATTPERRFLSPDELGAPLYAARSRMSDGRRVAVSLDVHARSVEYVAREGGADFFSRSDWRERLRRIAGPEGTDANGAVETESAQRRAIEDELDRGRSILNERLQITTVNHICLPWGVSGRQTAAALTRLGYSTAFANRLRGLHAVKPGDDPHWLKRLPNRYILHLPGRGRRTWF